MVLFKMKTKKVTITHQKLIALMNWAFYMGKNDASEYTYRYDRDFKLEDIK